MTYMTQDTRNQVAWRRDAMAQLEASQATRSRSRTIAALNASLTPGPTTSLTTLPPAPSTDNSIPMAPSIPPPAFYRGGFDPLEILPESCAVKLRDLRQRSEDAHAIVPFGQELRDLSLAKISAERALQRVVGHPHNFGLNLPTNSPQAIAAQKLVDKTTSDLERLRDLEKVRTESWRKVSAALAPTEAWLKNGVPAGCAIIAVDDPPPPLKRGEAIADALERIRALGRAARATLDYVRARPLPSAAAKAAARERLDTLCKRGRRPALADLAADGLAGEDGRWRGSAAVLGSDHRRRRSGCVGVPRRHPRTD